MTDLDRLRAERMDILARMVQDLTRELDDARKEIAVKRHTIDLLTRQAGEMRAACGGLIEAANSGEWHSGQDCDAEGRVQDCHLCQAIANASAALAGEGRDG